MKKLPALGVAVLAAAFATMAQETPQVEVSGGYSYVRSITYSDSFSGGSGAFAWNFNRWVGVVADFGGYKLTGIPGVKTHIQNYVFGPRFSYRSDSKFTPFIQILYGGAHGSTNAIGVADAPPPIRLIGDAPNSMFTSPQRGHATEHYNNGLAVIANKSMSSFAMTMGGGVDYAVAPVFAVRLIQAEYFMTRFGSKTQNNVRLTFGVVFRLGGK